MTWVEFLWLYALAAVLAAVWLLRSGYAPLRLVRVLAAIVPLGFFVDQPAESRLFWYFHPPLTATVLDVPLANVLFAVATAVFALAIRRRTQTALAARRTGAR